MSCPICTVDKTIIPKNCVLPVDHDQRPLTLLSGDGQIPSCSYFRSLRLNEPPRMRNVAFKRSQNVAVD
jgi:hypothetical protein